MPVVLERRLSVVFENPLSAVPGMAEQLETFLAEPEQVVVGQHVLVRVDRVNLTQMGPRSELSSLLCHKSSA